MQQPDQRRDGALLLLSQGRGAPPALSSSPLIVMDLVSDRGLDLCNGTGSPWRLEDAVVKGHNCNAIRDGGRDGHHLGHGKGGRQGMETEA